MSSRSIHEEITFIASLISKSSPWIINITYQWLVSVSNYQCLSVYLSVLLSISDHSFIMFPVFTISFVVGSIMSTTQVPLQERQTCSPSSTPPTSWEYGWEGALFEDASAKVKGPIWGLVSFQELTDQWGDRPQHLTFSLRQLWKVVPASELSMGLA